MKTCRLLVAIALSALAVSCSDKASVSGTLEGAGGKQLILKRLDVSHYKVLDTLTTSSSGAWSYSLKVEQGHPQFLYAFYGEQKVASLLVSPGERIKLVSDTLGHYSVRGSGESERLRQVEADFAAFLAEMTGIVETSDNVERDLSRSYIAYRRSRLSYVMENSHSLTIVPVLFQQVNETLPIFNEPTDAILFRNLADSLRSVYPESAYVKALDKEAERRSTLLELDLRLRSAGEVGFIDMELPSMDGSKKKLSETQGKVVMLYFWAATDAQKMFNLDALIPLYEEFHPRGFEIYAVSFDVDKTDWAGVVRRQGLPWINVCDTRGADSPLLATYQVRSLPMAWFIVDGALDTEASVSDAASIRKYLSSKL